MRCQASCNYPTQAFVLSFCLPLFKQGCAGLQARDDCLRRSPASPTQPFQAHWSQAHPRSSSSPRLAGSRERAVHKCVCYPARDACLNQHAGFSCYHSTNISFPMPTHFGHRSPHPRPGHGAHDTEWDWGRDCSSWCSTQSS
jgi:hypothetical protein